jgi:hypothetical protein
VVEKYERIVLSGEMKRKIILWTKLRFTVLGSIVNVLAISPKVRGFTPGRGDEFLKSASRLPSEEQYSRRSHIVNISRHVKRTLRSMKQIFRKKKFVISFASSSSFVTR